jgi:hypothetical protein
VRIDLVMYLREIDEVVKVEDAKLGVGHGLAPVRWGGRVERAGEGGGARGVQRGWRAVAGASAVRAESQRCRRRRRRHHTRADEVAAADLARHRMRGGGV